jgi:hypothetical protein
MCKHQLMHKVGVMSTAKNFLFSRLVENKLHEFTGSL